MSTARTDQARHAPERPVVAAFDFDGTLTRGGSVWPFLVAMCGTRRTLLAGLATAPRLVAAAVLGGTAADRAKEALFRHTLGGMDAAELARRAAVFGVAHYARRRRADVAARLEQHRRQGHRLVIVSASPELYVGAVGAELDMHAVIATRLEVGLDGRLTGRYDDRNCRGGQKLDRLSAWMSENVGGERGPPVVWAYGNSGGDRCLLRGSEVGVDVGRLGRLGKLRAFRRLRDAPQPTG
ncbi:MAG: HAD family hydrolase [Acidimicrobiales bacterium]